MAVLDALAEMRPAPDPWRDHERVTVALLGSDAGPGRSGDRLDAMLVASVHPDSGALAVFSVDRYMRDFPLPGELAGLWNTHCRHGDGWEYLNALYRCGTDRIAGELAARYPDARDPAATLMRTALGKMLGVNVDYYALVDMGGFVRLVDALGGVEVHVARPVQAAVTA